MLIINKKVLVSIFLLQIFLSQSSTALGTDSLANKDRVDDHLNKDRADIRANKDRADFAMILRQMRRSIENIKNADVMRWWLARGALEAQGRTNDLIVPMTSALWVAAGATGACIENYPYDNSGAGIWPVAMHNYLVHNININRSKGETLQNQFQFFKKSKQSRLISYDDLLNSVELKSFITRSGSCAARSNILQNLERLNTDYKDANNRTTIAVSMLHFLMRARETINAEFVMSNSLIEARIFDLKLYLASQKKGKGGRPMTAPEKAELLQLASKWNVSDWMSLRAERRLFLYSQIADSIADYETKQKIILGIIDALISEKKGTEISDWVAFLNATEYEQKKVIWDGQRGDRLLGLGAESGFTHRGVVALHRGVYFFQAGDVREALRSFSLAIKYSDESAQPQPVRLAARRWLSYVAGSYDVKPELVAVLKEVLPREDFNIILQDLVWRSALHFDNKSFDSLMKFASGQAAWTARLQRLVSLSRGKVREFNSELNASLNEDPYASSKFITELFDHIESEEIKIRKDLNPVLLALQGQFLSMQADPEKGKSSSRFLSEALIRCDALLKGSTQGGAVLKTARENIRSLNPKAVVFAGSVRLAPTDILPWEFLQRTFEPPSVFLDIGIFPAELVAKNMDNIPGWKFQE